MAVLRIYSDIMSQDDKFWYSWWGLECVCYQDIDTFAASIPKDDDTIDMRIFCNGGSVIEGWAIYDRLRQSGKKITCIIEGKAASMATIIMLAAPKENRRAYKNASLLLHNPWVPGWALGDQLNAKDLENQAEEMRMWQNKMVDAYVERCECDRDEIQALMDKDIFIDTDKAIELGLISSTVPAISASASKCVSSYINTKKSNPKAMEKKTEVKASLLNKILAKIGVKTLEEAEAAVQVPQAKTEPVAMELNTADGQTLTVEREEGEPQVGDKASPDGTFEMPDGKTIVVEEGVITDIQTSDDGDGDTDDGGDGGDGSASADDDTVAKLQSQVSALQKQLTEVKAQLASAQKMAKSKDELRILNAVKMAGGEKVLANISSHYQPPKRQPSGKGAGEQVDVTADAKTISEKVKAFRSKKRPSKD